MHTFSLHTQNDKHIGFLVMLPDNQHKPKDKGTFAIRIIDEQFTQLNQWENYNGSLLWEARGDTIALFTDANQHIGSIKQQYFTINGHQLILNDLTGVI